MPGPQPQVQVCPLKLTSSKKDTIKTASMPASGKSAPSYSKVPWAQGSQRIAANGQPHLFEKSLWDYKEEMPVPTPGASQSKLDNSTHTAKMADVVKERPGVLQYLRRIPHRGREGQPRALVGFSKGSSTAETWQKSQRSHTTFNWLPLCNHTTPCRRRAGRCCFVTHSSAPRRRTTSPVPQGCSGEPQRQARHTEKMTFTSETGINPDPLPRPRRLSSLCSPGRRLVGGARHRSSPRPERQPQPGPEPNPVRWPRELP